MANDDLLFKFRADGTEAVAEAKRVRAAIVNEAQGAARQFSTAGTTAGAAFGAGLRQSSADIQTGLVTSLKSAQREGDGLFNVLTQLRIGLTQIGRGDIGGVPNLIRAYREFTGVGSEAKRTVQVLDAALVASGASSTRAGDLMVEFGGRIKTALSGSGDEAQRLRRDFETMGISLSDAVLRPEQAFTRLLKNFGSARQDSAEFNAGLNLLGTGLGSVEQAAGTAGRSMTQLSAGFGITAGAAVATGGAILVVIAAIAAVVVAVKLFEIAVNGIVDTAKQLGTKSKDDFEEFKKRVESAGFAVTQLDRNLSQGVVKALDQVRGASDGLFLQMVRQTGPDLITLLRSVAAMLRDIAPLAELAGRFISANFTAATAAVRTFQQLLAVAKTDLLAFTLLIGDLPLIGALFAANVSQAAKDAKNVASTLPKATFDDDAAKKAKDATLERIRLLEIEERAAQRVFNEETQGAERAFRLRLIDGEELVGRLTLAEKTLLAAKLRTIEAERQAVEDGSLTDEKAATKRAELREKELQALSDYNRAIQKINDDAAQRADDGIRKALEDARKVAEARIRLISDLTQLQSEIRQTQIDSLQTTADTLSRTPGREQEAIEARARVFVEQERLRHDQIVADLEARRAENDLAERDAAEKLAIATLLNQQLEEEERRHQQALAALRQETTVALERAQPFSARTLFGDTFADDLAQTGSTLHAFGQSAASTFTQLSASAGNFNSIATGALQQFGQGLAQTIQAFVLTGKTGPAALKKLTAAVLAEVAAQAAVKAIFELAAGFAALAIGDPRAAMHFQAAALYGSLAGVAAGLGSAVAGSGSGGGPVGQQLTGTRQSENAIPTEERIRFREGNQFVVQITLKTDQAQQVTNVEKAALTSYNNGGTVKQVLDNHAGNIPIG